jgi:predicted RNA-binding Zn ribbon-like protein
MSRQEFDLGSGALCLDFANTVNWHASDSPVDDLADYTGLLAFSEQAGLLPAGRRAELDQLARHYPAEAAATYERAVELREAIYRIFAGLSAGRDAAAADLAILNDFLARALPHQQIVAEGDGFAWGWRPGLPALDEMLRPVARSAADWLVSADLDRVRECADDRGCGYLFVDTSRNRSRRWCSMESCGNRAKARRHYERSHG